MIKCLLFAFLIGQTQVAEVPPLVKEHKVAAIKKWSKDIEALEALDRKQKDPKDAILFLGSSSVRRWNTISEDMAPWPTIKRGYGGAKFSDLAIFARRLTKSHTPRAIAIFVANDIAGKDTDKTPEEVLELVRYVVDEVKDASDGKPVFLIAITPTSSRFGVWDAITQVNQLMAKFAESTKGVHYIATANEYLVDGKPNDALFVDDRLHLNDDGYDIWARVIKAALEKELGSPVKE